MPSDDLVNEHTYTQMKADRFIRERAQAAGLSRRRFLQVVAAASGAALVGDISRRTVNAQAATDLVVKPTPPELFYDLGANKEMRWEGMYSRGYLVPNELFFVRNHSRTARLDVASWRLRIEGSGVSSPRDFTYDDILALPSVSVVRFVECAGNGRSFFEAKYGKKAQGGQWKLGAIGVAEWTGVPLREVLDRAGLKRTAKDVMPEGLDELRVRRPMPIAKALADDTLLVYAMNGQTLPPDHGFPARVLVPGWVGVANVKWVGRIEVSEQPLWSAWNTESYVLIGPGYKPNPPAQGPVLSFQTVKSAFELQWDGQLAPGPRLLRGRSWSGRGKITKVEVSLNGGATWQPARLREPNLPQAWVRWDVDWNAQPGSHSLVARATDEHGNVQPGVTPWNDQGYLYGGIVVHPVTVSG
jgi:DMSO/TMAO reductase YedYZ molybdopterin-dependent catalytic subunit